MPLNSTRIYFPSDDNAPSCEYVGQGTIVWSERAAQTSFASLMRAPYQAFLRTVPNIEEYIFTLRDRNLMTSAMGSDQALILKGLAELSGDNLRKWLDDENADYGDFPTHAAEMEKAWQDKYQALPTTIAKNTIRKFLSDRDVQYTNDEFNEMFGIVAYNIRQTAMPIV
jgi:hypothetical protein